MIANVLFFITLFFIIYPYLIYPVLLLILCGTKRGEEGAAQKDGGAFHYPSLSLVIAAYNEEGIISEKIKNSLDIDYPGEMEVIIISDGSDDQTPKIIKSWQKYNHRLKGIIYSERKGKSYALNCGVSMAMGDIIVFSDANVMYSEEAVRRIVERFRDLSIGCVVGKVLLKSEADTELLGEGAYMKFERLLFKLESRFYSMTGTDGAMYAIRKESFHPIREDLINDDIFTALNAVRLGKRIVYEDKAIGYELIRASVANEVRRKARIIAGGFQLLHHIQWIWNIRKYSKAAFCLTSHKILRWVAPFFILINLVTAVFLAEYPLPMAVGIVYLFTMATAALAYAVKSFRSNVFFYIPYYFYAVNIAALIGFGRYLRNKQRITWKKAR